MALNNPFALSFDGEDDYTQCPQNALLNVQAHTVECWISVDDPAGYRPAFCLTSASSSYPSILIRIVSGKLQYYMRAGTSTAVDLTAKTSFVVGVPYHIACVYTGANMYIYINGILDAERTAAHTVVANTGLRLGSFLTQHYKGAMDELRFWSVARTGAEINANKNLIIPDHPDLVLRYNFDSGSGDTVYDQTTNGLDATITGATWVPGLVDLDDLAPPGRVDISATLRGSSSATAKADRIRGLSAHLTGAATATGGTPIRIRGLSANLVGAGTTNIRMNLIAALKAHLQGKATLKSNMLVLFVPEGVFVIDADEIFAKNQPSRGQVVANYIEVWINPLKPVTTAEEVYRSKDPITIPAGETKTITVYFDDEPVTEPAVALDEAGAGLSITDTKHYAWGADVTIKNAGAAEQTCLIVATGKPLKVQGREKIVKKDEVSIQENGLKKYTFDNPFVQDRATAELIADKLLSFANAKRDIKIDWRGDPAVELADVTMIPEYQRRGLDQRGIFYVTKQELEFDGGLQAKLEGRKM